MRLFPKDRDLNQAPEEVELTVESSVLGVPAKEVAVRLDHYLARALKWRSRSSVQALIREGLVSIDPTSPDHPRGWGRFQLERRPGRRLRHKSRIRVRIPEEQRLLIEPARAEDLVVLFEDESVLAVEKPPFLAVHPSGRHMSGTLIQQVYARYPEVTDREARPRLCHRLDRETSGIVLIGKHPEAHADCMRQFEERKVGKEYWALVHGSPEQDKGVLDLPLGPARGSAIELKMAIRFDGQDSVTEWNVVERRSGCTLVACRPKTGRQHQIRVHMQALGHPLVGDKLYGEDEELFQRALEDELTDADRASLGLERHALHNHYLAFRSPETGERVEVTSPLPADLAEYFDERV